MMIRVNGEYLDFNDPIEIESQIKLFDEISTSNGDFSYSFEISKTTKNLKALGFPLPDTVKSIYQNVPCEILDDSGFKVYTGSLKVESISDVINCSFFGGNNDWFGLLSEPMSSLPLYKYDVTLTESNIEDSWTKESGIIFPILDAGVLVTRSYPNLMVEDFTSAFYVKTLFNEIFNSKGIKLEGDLLKDALYNMLTVTSNTKSQGDITTRSCYVEKTSVQNNITTAYEKITFDNESVFPYFDGSVGNFDASTYTADVKMRVSVNLSLEVDLDGIGIPFSTAVKISYYINGLPYYSFVGGITFSPTTVQVTNTIILQLNAGDYLEVFAKEAIGNGNIDVNSGSITITPTYIYKVFGKSSVPDWTQGEFVSNILRMFNVLPSFNSHSKTLTLNLFNKIKDKTPIDVSDNISVTNTDFSRFVSDYGKNNLFKYQEGSDENLREYNISNFISYGSGNLEVSNDFIENSADVVESDFTTPITYLNGVFDCSTERIDFVELEEIEDKTITSVTDSSGTPRFNITNADNLFTAGDLVRIDTGSDSDYEYSGDWVINSVTNTYITVVGAVYGTGADGTATLMRHKFTTSDSVYLFANVVNKETLFFSSLSSMAFGVLPSSITAASLAYFNLLANGRQINTKYKQSLSFGEVNNPLSYQKTILDTYWGIFSDILSDPVMLTAEGHFDRNKFQLLKSFLRPLRIKTNETNNLYYLNRITGYQSGHEPCEVELIKL